VWALPGGRVHAGESLEEAVEREIREETGIHVQVGSVVHVFDVIERNEDDLSVHYVIIDYRAEYVSGDLRAGDDALEAGWVSKDEIGERAVNDSTRLLLKQKFGFR
jgi:ADP-ribose pyrophosphatase